MLSFKEWKGKGKTGLTQDTLDIMNFENNFPDTAQEYKSRAAAEAKKRSEIMQIKDGAERRKAISENMGIFGY